MKYFISEYRYFGGGFGNGRFETVKQNLTFKNLLFALKDENIFYILCVIVWATFARKNKTFQIKHKVWGITISTKRFTK